MITLFTIPKGFEHEHTAIIQHNAIASWRRLMPEADVVLFGNDPGVAEAAKEHGCRHVPDVAVTEHGTPLLNDVFRLANDLSRFDTLCYVNADIILLQSFMDAVRDVRRTRDQFLLVGRRTNLDVVERLAMEDGWAESLKAWAERDGELFTAAGIDYFCYPTSQFRDIPPFAVGRTLWDNWFIYEHRRRGIPVIEATGRVLAVHQNHDYGHIKGAVKGLNGAWKGTEAQKNIDICGPDFVPFTLNDSTHLLTAQGIVPAREPRRILRRLMVTPALIPGVRRSVRYARAAKRKIRPIAG